MNIEEIHNQIRVQFEALAAQTLDNFLPQEIDLYINKAVREYIEQNRPVLLQDEQPNRRAEAVEKMLRTLIYSHIYDDTDFSDMSTPYGGYSVPLGDTDPNYEYFVTGRLETDKNVYNAETVSVKAFYEHLQTRHNLPLFRRPKVVGRGNELLVSVPDPDEAPVGLEMTYLGGFKRVDIEMVLEYDFSGSGSTVIIEGVEYPATSPSDFLTTHKQDVRSRHDVMSEELSTDVLRLTTYNSGVKEEDFGGDVSVSTTTSRTEIPLPVVSHQDLINLTVRLMRRDLPQVESPDLTPEQKQQLEDQRKKRESLSRDD